MWIMKPTGKAQGKGIFLINKLAQVKKWATGREGCTHSPGVRLDYTGWRHKLVPLAIRPIRVALTPGGCQIGYMDRTGCRQLNVFCLQNNVNMKSANPIPTRGAHGGALHVGIKLTHNP